MNPLQNEYPFASPYNYTLNNPILFRDYDGKDIIISNNGEEFTFTLDNNSYTGSNEFIMQTVSALNHLIEYENISDAEFKVITRLASDENVDSQVTKNAIDRHPGSTGNKAQWNPKQGTVIRDAETGEMVLQSPVTTLIHELAHTFQEFFRGELNEDMGIGTMEEYALFMKRSKQSPYDNFTEEGVIVNVEVPYSKYAGEAWRKDHDTFDFVEVTGDYTSTTECTSCGAAYSDQKEVKINQ